MSSPNRSPALRVLPVLLAAVALLAPPLARAAATADDSKVEKIVVRNRLHTVKGKFEVSPGVGFTLTNKLTEHTNFELGLGYNLFETFAVELRGGYALGGLTSVSEQVQTEIYADSPVIGGTAVPKNATPNDFADLWQLQWQALILPRWQPIYGKLNLATEVPIHFQVFLTAGGGYVGLHRESIVYCQNGGTGRGAECAEYLQEDRQDVAFGAGGGLRFWAYEDIQLKIELFDLAFFDDYREQVSRAEAEKEAPGAEPAQGTMASNPGLTHLIFLNIGATFLF